jgi:hypothetical protein
MPNINCPKAHAALSADGSGGYVTVTDASPFYPGAHVWLKSNTVAPTEYVITDIATGNKIGCRAVTAMNGGASYTKSDMSGFKVADAATIDQAVQVVPVEVSTMSVKLSV